MAGLVDRRAGNGIAGEFFDRDAFAGQGRFVDDTMPFRDDTVHRHAFPCLDDEDIADGNRVGRNGFFNAVFQKRGGFGGELHQARNSFGRFAFCAGFKITAERDQGQDDGGRFEIQVHGEIVRHHHVTLAEGETDFIDRVNARDGGRSGTDSNQGIHIRRTGKERLEPDPVKMEIDENDRDRQEKLGEREGKGIFRAEENRGQRQTCHMAHRNVEQRNGEEDRDEQACPDGFQLKGGGVSTVVSSCVGRFGAVMRDSAVTGAFDGFYDGPFNVGPVIFIRFVVGNTHRVFEQIDADVFHASDGSHGLVDPCGAGRAGHAGNVELFFLHGSPHVLGQVFSKYLQYRYNCSY